MGGIGRPVPRVDSGPGIGTDPGAPGACVKGRGALGGGSAGFAGCCGRGRLSDALCAGALSEEAGLLGAPVLAG